MGILEGRLGVLMASGDTILKSAIRQCRGNIGVTVFFSFFINLLMFVAPLHMLQMYDRVLVSRSTVTLLVITGLAIGLLLIYGLLEAVRLPVKCEYVNKRNKYFPLDRNKRCWVFIKFDELISNSVFKAVFSEAVARQGGATVGPLRDVESRFVILSLWWPDHRFLRRSVGSYFYRSNFPYAPSSWNNRPFRCSAYIYTCPNE